MRKTLMIARYPGGGAEHPDSSDWVMETLAQVGPLRLTKKGVRDGAAVRIYESQHPDFDKVLLWYKSDTPIDMVRNLSVQHAKELDADYMLLIDSDMQPDENPEYRFWQRAWGWIRNREAPSVIAAPYCGGGNLHNNVFVFRWETFTNSHAEFKLAQYTRDEAAHKTGIEEVAALPTGLMLIDMRVFERMRPPYFYYEWTDETHSKKASTEDVTFSRDLSLAWASVPGAGCYCDWDAWAFHIKPGYIGRPTTLDPRVVGQRFRELVRNETETDRVIEWDIQTPDLDALRDKLKTEDEDANDLWSEIREKAGRTSYLLRKSTDDTGDPKTVENTAQDSTATVAVESEEVAELREELRQQAATGKTVDRDKLTALVEHDYADLR